MWVLLKCIHFSSKVYPHKFIMDEQSIAWGRMRAGPGERKVCVDHLQKDMVSNHVVFFVNQYGFLVLNRTIIAKEMERKSLSRCTL